MSWLDPAIPVLLASTVILAYSAAQKCAPSAFRNQMLGVRSADGSLETLEAAEERRRPRSKVTFRAIPFLLDALPRSALIYFTYVAPHHRRQTAHERRARCH